MNTVNEHRAKKPQVAAETIIDKIIVSAVETETLLNINNVDVGYDNSIIVNGVSLELKAGEIGCLLGPSGYGKSTLLKAIAGFEPLKGGSISLSNNAISDQQNTLAPEQRNIGMVFQDVALFPHFTIEQNIAFGLKKLTKEQQTHRVKQLLKLIDLTDKLNDYPHQLSGGQQQRVALARALAPRPKLILLDEPFSGLDAKLRDSLVPQVRDILKQENVSAIMVSHDQSEAFAIADRIAIMQSGAIHQWDTAYQIYNHPKTKFVASFVGKNRFLPGQVNSEYTVSTLFGEFKSTTPHGYQLGKDVDVVIRFDDIKQNLKGLYCGTVNKKQFDGSYFIFELVLADGTDVVCRTPFRNEHQFNIGDQLNFDISVNSLIIFEQ